MSSSPTFIVSQTKGVEEEKWLAIDQGRSHTSSPRSRPNSRLEILIMDMARSQEERARSQEQKLDGFARSTEEKLDGFVGNLCSNPGSLHRATGEIVTESEVSRVFRGTDKWQSDLGSWEPSTAREGRPKGDITSLTSEVIEGRVAINGAVTWGGTAWNAK